jgi:hypothetical protein
MKKWLKTINAWRVGRYQFSQERWERVRAKGRGQFVLREGLTWMVIMIAFRDVTGFIFYGSEASSLWSYGVQYFVTGIVVGYMTWGEQESNYKKGRLNPPVSDPANNQILPH